MPGARSPLVRRVAAAIGTIRRSRGLTQEGLAAALDIAAKNVQRIESGKQNLSLETIERICTALDVPPERLFMLDDAVVTTGVPTVRDRLEQAGFRVRSAAESGRRASDAVPIMTVKAAAGRLDGTGNSAEILGWVRIPDVGARRAGTFVAEVRGTSMEPRIPDGALGLFAPARGSPSKGRTLLIANTDDAELGGPYVVKVVDAVETLSDGRTRVHLRSENPMFPPLVIDGAEQELRVIAELVRVLAPKPSTASRQQAARRARRGVKR